MDLRRRLEDAAKTTSLDCIEIRHKKRPYAKWQGKSIPAARLVWILAHGDPGQLWILHHCDNQWCVNINHLYSGTPKDNARDRDVRGRNGSKPRTHCPNGHFYTDETIYIRPNSGKRRCRICKAATKKRYKIKAKQMSKAKNES